MEDYDGVVKIGIIFDDKKALKQLEEITDGTSDISDGFKAAEKASLSFGDVLKANVLSDAITSGFRRLSDALGSFVSGSVSTAAELKEKSEAQESE